MPGFIAFVVSYFEDKISETKIFETFVNTHLDLYQKPLPFYKCEDYIKEEINLDDVKFVIWYYLELSSKSGISSPNNRLVQISALIFMEIFELEYEYAPENEALIKFYTPPAIFETYYDARDFLHKIIFENYLLYPDTGLTIAEKQVSLFDDTLNEDHSNYQLAQVLVNEHTTEYLYNCRTKLLALSAQEWGAELLGADHKFYTDLKEMSKRVIGYFQVIKRTKEHFILKHIGTEKIFQLTRIMLDALDDDTQLNSIHRLGIVKWRGDWWFSGMYFPLSKDSIIENENLENILSVFNLSENLSNYQDHYKLLKKSFLKYTGHEVVFMTKVELQKFIDKFISYHNKNLPEVLSDVDNNVDTTNSNSNFFNQLNIPFEENEILTIRISETHGVEIVLGVEHAFPLAHNQYGKQDQMARSFKEVFFGGGSSADFTKYCIETCKDKYDFMDESWNLFIGDLDFSLRFFKSTIYHPKATGFTRPAFIYGS